MKLKQYLLMICLLATVAASAQTHSNEIGLQVDNDSFLAQGSDRYYTNGAFLYYRHALTINTTAHPLLANKVLGFEVGQKLFNPQSGYVPGPQYVDRPFAGYLYAGANLNFLYKNESNLKLSAQLGVVGPASGGEEAQKFIHDTFGFYTLGGWQYQIKNDAELNLGAEYNKLIARASWIDVTAGAYANLGNGFTGAGIGPLLRAGNFNQLFNSVSTQSTVSKGGQVAPLHKHELFFYYKPQLNYVLYDATIQGGLFDNHNDPYNQEITLDKKPLIFSQQFGIAYSGERFVFDVNAIFHTKDVKEMIRSHQWGSVTMLYKFK
ncbi:lipid A deacylase LpxR family protein [soil metagenome]